MRKRTVMLLSFIMLIILCGCSEAKSAVHYELADTHSVAGRQGRCFFMYFKKKERPRQSKFRFSNIDNIVIENSNMYFELLPKHRMIEYRNIIYSRDGGRWFPDGYFDKKTVSITDDDIKQISSAFDRMVQTQAFENELSILPDGCAHDAYMRITMNGNKVAYYANKHTAENSYSVEVEPVSMEFLELVQLLKKHCSFPQYVPEGTPVMQSPELLCKVNVDVEADKKSAITGYRFDETGVFGYVFYKANEKICTASSIVAPSEHIMIHGNGVMWRSDFEDHTITPGLTRTVTDKSSGKQVFQIVYKDRGQYEINGSVIVYCHMDKYAFYSDSKPIAVIKRTDHDFGPYFDIVASNEIEPELLMVILAFPLLEFGI